MRTRFLLLACWLSCSPLHAADTSTLEGCWHNVENAVTIEILPTTGGYQGIVRDNPESPRGDGKRMLQLDRPDGHHTWSGTMFAVKRNTALDATLMRKGSDMFSLDVKLGFFTKSMDWRRVDRPCAENTAGQ